MQEATPRQLGQRLGHYRLLGEAGRGGMSVVHEAYDERMERRVALKVVTVPSHLSPTQRDEMVARLRREARAIARLSHPNVVGVYDVGEQNGAHYIVMEFLDGQTLRERLDRGPLPPDEAARILDQVAGALDAVHAEGVVHRDIKPSNVMLTPDGRAVLMDFGVARQTDDTLVTQAGMMVGSPAYMAPEMINGSQATYASDLWSLGVLLYQMLVGQPPFGSKNIPTVLYQVTHANPEPIPGLPSRAQRVIARALEKNPTKRFGSGRELANAFHAALGAPQAVTPRQSAASRRWPAPAWLGPVLAALLLLPATLAASLFGHWLAGRHQAARLVHVAPARPASLSTQKPPPQVRVAAMRQERISSAPTKTHYSMATTPIAHRRVHVRPRVRHPRLVSSPMLTVAKRPLPVMHRRHRRFTPAAPQAPAVPRQPDVPQAEARQHVPARAFRTHRRPILAAQSVRTTPVAAGIGSGNSSLVGTWHGWQGIHGHDPAVLTITRHQGSTFDGVMTVRTPEHATVRVALTGHVAPGGRVTMREKKILSTTKPHAWDLGSKSGQFGPNGRMSGVDHDVRGRTASWSFSK